METWRAIAGYKGLYEVSDIGRVKSLGNNKYRKEKILTPGKNTGGYLRIGLSKDGHTKYLLVHRLVAEAFIPNPNNLETVNHKDEVKTNNTVSNLEWMSREDNVAYSRPQWEKRSVQMFDKSTGELLATFPSLMEAERVTGIDDRSISKCCNGKLKTHKGYIWRYK